MMKKITLFYRYFRQKANGFLIGGSKKVSLRAVLFLISFCIFFVSGILVVNRLYSLNKENKDFDKLRQSNLARETKQPEPLLSDAAVESKALIEDTASDPEEIPYSVIVKDSSQLNEAGLLKIYEKNKALNSDMAGWIYMPGFRKAVDYPVMQAEDNLFYLYKDFYKNKSFCGSIFMDASNHPETVDRNIVLYGHAMLEMSMFGNLIDYPDKEEKHIYNTRIYLDLMNMQLEYEVFSTYYTQASFNYRQVEFRDDEEFGSFLKEILSKSVYDYKLVPTARDKILTLSTCNSYSGDDDRVVIHARLTRQTVFTGTSNNTPVDGANSAAEKEVVSANMYLDKLELQYNLANQETVFEKAELDPGFVTDVRKYKASLPAQAREYRLLVEAEDPKASIKVYLDDTEVNPESITLKKGTHTIYVVVTARDGKYSRAYSIEIIK